MIENEKIKNMHSVDDGYTHVQTGIISNIIIHL